MITQQMISEHIKMIQSSLSPSIPPAQIHTSLPVFVCRTSEDPSFATQH